MIVALIVCCAAICVLCAGGVESQTVGAVGYGKNDSIYVEARDEDVLYIGGEGRLYKSELSRCLEETGIAGDSVHNVIVGDGITELGFGMFGGLPNLSTLFAGRNVTVINRGAVLDCDLLTYVYVPSGLKRVGKDFLFGCPNAFVVTDGSATDLPSMKYVSHRQILEEINSYDGLLSRLEDGTTGKDGEANTFPVPAPVMACWWE